MKSSRRPDPGLTTMGDSLFTVFCYGHKEDMDMNTMPAAGCILFDADTQYVSQLSQLPLRMQNVHVRDWLFLAEDGKTKESLSSIPSIALPLQIRDLLCFLSLRAFLVLANRMQPDHSKSHGQSRTVFECFEALSRTFSVPPIIVIDPRFARLSYLIPLPCGRSNSLLFCRFPVLRTTYVLTVSAADGGN